MIGTQQLTIQNQPLPVASPAPIPASVVSTSDLYLWPSEHYSGELGTCRLILTQCSLFFLSFSLPHFPLDPEYHDIMEVLNKA